MIRPDKITLEFIRGLQREKWLQMLDPDIATIYPYVGVDTAMDSRTRPNHFALDWRRIKTVFRVNDPNWIVCAPPFGEDCRCGVRVFMEEEVRTLNLAVGLLKDWLGRTEEVELPMGEKITARIVPDKNFKSGLQALFTSEEMKTITLACFQPPEA